MIQAQLDTNLLFDSHDGVGDSAGAELDETLVRFSAAVEKELQNVEILKNGEIVRIAREVA